MDRGRSYHQREYGTLCQRSHQGTVIVPITLLLCVPQPVFDLTGDDQGARFTSYAC